MLTGVIQAILSAFCFGMLAILGKLAYARGFATFEILQYRFGFAAVMLFVYILATQRHILRAGPRTLVKAVVLGALFYPLQSICFMSSLQYVSAATTSLILYFYPVMVTILSVLFFKARFDRTVVFSLILVMAGCGLVFFDAFLRSMSQTGILLATMSMLVFSFYLICVHAMLKGENPRTVSFYVIVSAGLVYTVLAPPVGFLQLDGGSMLLTLALGLIPTALAVTLLYASIEKIGSAFASICSTLEPIATVLASAFVLGEDILAIQVGGMALIMVGVALPNLRILGLRAPSPHGTT